MQIARNSTLAVMARYVVARGGPGLVSLLALSLYTRLLTPEEYGQYALVLGGLGLVQVVGFQWLGLSLARFLPANRDSPEHFLGETRAIFVALALGFGAVGLAIAGFWPDPVWQKLVVLAVPLLVAKAWFELNLIHAAAVVKPSIYGILNLTKSIIALSVGWSLALCGFGAFSPMSGLLLGMVLSTLVFGRTLWRGVKTVWPSRERLEMLLEYGMPLAVNSGLVWVVSTSDRFLLGWLLDVSAAGQYSVSYDLAQNSIGMLLMIANLAAYPLAVHALERGGPSVARDQLRENGALFFGLAFAAVAGVAVLAPLLGGLLLGDEYGDVAARLLPWVAAAAALSGLKAYHFDTAFHLGRSTRRLVWISVGAASVNIIFNLIWIPRYGLLGAAYATVLTYGMSLVASAWLGRDVFALPKVLPLLVPAMLVFGATGAAAWIGMQCGGWMGLGLGVLSGSVAATLCAIGINLGGIRHELWKVLRSSSRNIQ